jgi:hypothetical protein
MSSGEFATSVIFILIVMAVITAVEIVVPLFPRTRAEGRRRLANLGLTAIGFVVNWAFTSAAALLTLTEGPASWLGSASARNS